MSDNRNVWVFAEQNGGKLNEVALSSETDMFVTILIMCLDYANHAICMANAGHCYPLLRTTGGEVTRVEGANGFPVGITEQAEFPEETFPVHPGDVMCMFTDGIIEAMNEEDEQLGYEKLTEQLAAGSPAPEEVLARVQSAIRDHAGMAPQSDDLTLVCFGRSDNGAGEAGD